MFFAHLPSAPPRNCAHLPPRGRLPGRGILAMSPGRKICAFGIPRNSPHLPSKIFGNLSKNPVNLSKFTEIRVRRTRRAASPSYRNPPNPRGRQLRANARAGAGKTAARLARDSERESAERITGDMPQGNRGENHDERPAGGSARW